MKIFIWIIALSWAWLFLINRFGLFLIEFPRFLSSSLIVSRENTVTITNFSFVQIFSHLKMILKSFLLCIVRIHNWIQSIFIQFTQFIEIDRVHGLWYQFGYNANTLANSSRWSNWFKFDHYHLLDRTHS